MSDRLAVAEQVVSIATIETPHGTATAVAVEQLPVATAVAEQGIAGPPGELSSKVIRQDQPSAEWILAHNLSRYPSVTLVDSAGDQFDADTKYVDDSTIIVTLNAPTSGVAYIN